MIRKPSKVLHRRNFLRGAAGLTVGLPFLEALPGRSAWAQGDKPVFSLFMVAANGVVPNRFFPGEGPLTAATLNGKAVAALSDYASNLLVVSGLRLPSGTRGCGHAEGLCQSLTGVGPSSTGSSAQSGGQSVDMFISQAVNEQGKDPITMYAGAGNYIKERISFSGRGAARPMQLNPYATFQQLLGIVDNSAPSTPNPSVPSPGGPSNMVDEILLRRKSVLDTVRTEISELQNLTAVSAEDKQRLQLHYEAFREIEIDFIETGDQIGEMNGDNPAIATSCSLGSIDVQGIEAFSGGITMNQSGNMIEDVVRLHGEVTALAFACNYNRVGVLQWGDGTDGTRYAGLNAGAVDWPFHQVSHRVQDDGAVGQNANAEDTHAQIDVIRMKTLAQILKHFDERGLFGNSIVYWTNHVATGAHSVDNMPIVIAGSGGGYLKQGQHIRAGGDNKALLAAVAAAAGAGNFGTPLQDVRA